MMSYYTPVLILQAFCLYHAYRNNTQQQWFWIIIFIPLIGCGIYLYTHFWSRRNLENLTEGVKQVVNSNYKLQNLEKEVKYSATIANKTQLADAYMAAGRHAEAIVLYESCMKGLHDDDPELLRKALRGHYLSKNYGAAEKYGERLSSKRSFNDAEDRVLYAWSLAHLGKTDIAESIFQSIDGQFANYAERLEYSKFLLHSNRQAEAKKKLRALLDEFEHMDRYEQRLKKPVNREVKRVYDSLS